MGKGRWIVWLLLLMMTLAGCGTEAEVVTSEMTFEEESESEPEREVVFEEESETGEREITESEVELEGKLPLRVSVDFEAKCFFSGSGSVYEEYKPVVLHSSQELKDLNWPDYATQWEYQKREGLRIYEALGALFEEGTPCSLQSLADDVYDETFFSKYDLLVMHQKIGSNSFTARVNDILYIPENDTYEIMIHSENDSFGWSEGYGYWIFTIALPKGILYAQGENHNFSVKLIYEQMMIPASGHTPDGKNGVQAEMSYEYNLEIHPWIDEEAGEYGVHYIDFGNDNGTRVCYFEAGFERPKADEISEVPLPDGRTVVIGYDEEGNWQWVDFCHITGCYGAINKGYVKNDARLLLRQILRAKLGPIETQEAE